MRKRRYESYFDEDTGIRFDFKYDQSEPSMLHIFVRHATSPEEAIDTFFAGRTSWNDEHKRYETFTETHGLFWVWRVPRSVVMVISCFRRRGATWVSG